MNEKTSSPARTGRRWLRKFLWLAVILVVLVVGAFFVVTSGAFLKGFVLPRVGSAMNADLTAGQVAFSPFSELELRDVKLQPIGGQPVFTAALVRARYNLMSIIRGKIAVDEVTVESPTITVIQNADGTSNLDPLLKGKKESAPKAKPSESSKPLQIDVKSVSLKNATIRRVASLKGGGQESVELSDVNLTLADLRNGGTGKLDLSAALAMDNTAPQNTGTLRGKINASYSFDLTSDLNPARLNGTGKFTVEAATGKLADLSALTATLDCDVTPTEVKQVALRFTQSGQALGELRASGPFDAAKMEGKLNVAILSLDRHVLNMVGAASGIDFGTTVINSTNVVELTKGGSQIAASGQLNAAHVRLTRQGQTTPTLDLACNYAVTVNRTAQSAQLQSLNLLGAQNDQPLLSAGLTSPMTISFGGAAAEASDAALNLIVTNLNLADWKAFTGAAAPTGVANAQLKLLSQKGGKELTFDLNSSLDQLSAKFGSNTINQADIHLTARGSAADLKQFKLEDYRLDVSQQGQTAVAVNGSGTFDSATQNADLQVGVQATLARLLAMLPQPGANVSAGTVDFKGHVTSKGQNRTVSGKLTLADFTGSFGANRFANYGASVNCDLAMNGSELDIRKATGQLQEGQNTGGNFEASGNFDLEHKAGQLTAKLTDFNQNGLRPFLESALGDKKLVSVALNTTASANLAANGDATVKADAHLANLVVQDPKGTIPNTPLEARVQVDASVAKQIAQVRQCELTLTPTDRAKNDLNLTGNVDFSNTKAITGTMKLAAESLDVTHYYDLFAAKSKPAEAGATTSTQPPSESPASANQEPPPVKLPLHNFTLDANIGQFYLREVAITNLLTTMKIDGGNVVIDPFQLTLNGAPVNAKVNLDLGVPGYKYDVAFDAKVIPLTPFINSFQPDRKGQIGGTTTIGAQIKGAGTTGANLKQNLTGQFSVLSTNLNLSIANVRSPLLNRVINVIISIPDLIRNPTATLGNVLGQITGKGTGGWADQLTAAPIDVILLSGEAGSGNVQVQQAEVRSAAFQAGTQGAVALAPVLTNSTINFPVTVSLSRALGEKIGLVTASTPADAVYVPMPQFLTMTGTLGKPEHHINAMALGSLALKAGSGLVKDIGGAAGGKVGGILQGVGGLLGGNTAPAAGSVTNTNTPPPAVQPKAIVNDLFNLFKKSKK